MRYVYIHKHLKLKSKPLHVQKSHREALSHLLHPVIITTEHGGCLATSAQPRTFQGLVAVSNCLLKQSRSKVQKTWYDTKRQVACASVKHIDTKSIKITSEQAVEGKTYKTVLRRKRRAHGHCHAQQSL